MRIQSLYSVYILNSLGLSDFVGFATWLLFVKKKNSKNFGFHNVMQKGIRTPFAFVTPLKIESKIFGKVVLKNIATLKSNAFLEL